MEPQVFGWQHLLFLAICVVVLVASIILVLKLKRDEKKLKVFFICVALVHLATIIASRITMAMWGESFDWLTLIPDSFCSLSSVLLPIGLLFFLKKDSKYLHFIWYMAFVGGLLTILYPAFIDQDKSFFFGPTITGLLHHAMMVYTSVLLVVAGYFTPTLKKWYCFPIGGAFVMTFGIFLITAVGIEDAMHIETPLIEDTPLTWYVVAALTFAFAFALMAICDYFKYYKGGGYKYKKYDKYEYTVESK